MKDECSLQLHPSPSSSPFIFRLYFRPSSFILPTFRPSDLHPSGLPTFILHPSDLHPSDLPTFILLPSAFCLPRWYIPRVSTLP
ncbi:MAG: hypothetical protein ACXW5U_17285 [Thermoanaerobaculia bacterium]